MEIGYYHLHLILCQCLQESVVSLEQTFLEGLSAEGEYLEKDAFPKTMVHFFWCSASWLSYLLAHFRRVCSLVIAFLSIRLFAPFSVCGCCFCRTSKKIFDFLSWVPWHRCLKPHQRKIKALLSFSITNSNSVFFWSVVSHSCFGWTPNQHIKEFYLKSW